MEVVLIDIATHLALVLYFSVHAGRVSQMTYDMPPPGPLLPSLLLLLPTPTSSS